MMKKIVFLIILFLSSCALLKKTERITDLTTKTSSNQLESNQLVLKNVGKQTQVFSYWNDSGFYQYQLIKEVSEERGSSQLKTEDKQYSKEKLTNRKSEPIKIWGYMVALIVICACFVLYKRFK